MQNGYFHIEEETEKESDFNGIPVVLTVKKISGNGLIDTKFNQNLTVPIMFRTNSTSRRLATNDTLLAQEVLNLTYFLCRNDVELNDFTFDYIIQEWKETGMKVKVEFLHPLEVSRGSVKDYFQIDINLRQLFTSKVSGAWL